MADEEQQQPEEGQPTPEEQEKEQQPDDQESAEKDSEDVTSPEQSAPEQSAEPKAEEKPAEEKPEGEKKPAAEGKPEGGGKEKKAEVVPGAELDPIAIEPERPLDPEEKARREAEEEERARRERELIGEGDLEAPVAAKPTKLSGDARYAATGKRKSSIARVILTPGSGSIEVNKRKLEEYFPRSFLQSVAKQPLVQSGYETNVDVRIRVHGGGISGQAAAVRHGIARALCDVNPELRRELKRRGMLTRDARVKERRKAGLKKARKKPQFSKR